MRCNILVALAAAASWCALPTVATAQNDRLIVLVRHAEANGEPRQDPPLTEGGRARARALADALEHTDVRQIVVSPLARTRLTAEPLAQARGIPPTVADVAGGIDAHVAAVVDAVQSSPAGAVILVVGHSNTVPAIISGLGGPPLADLCHGEFSTLFVLHVRNDGTPRLIRSRYGEPDQEDACDGGE